MFNSETQLSSHLLDMRFARDVFSIANMAISNVLTTLYCFPSLSFAFFAFAIMNELSVYVSMSFVNVSICNSENDVLFAEHVDYGFRVVLKAWEWNSCCGE